MATYPVLGPGSSGPEVEDLQNNLNLLLGSRPGFTAVIPVSGAWDAATSSAFAQAKTMLGQPVVAIQTDDAFYNALLNALDSIDPATGSTKAPILMDPLHITSGGGTAIAAVAVIGLGLYLLLKK